MPLPAQITRPIFWPKRDTASMPPSRLQLARHLPPSASQSVTFTLKQKHLGAPGVLAYSGFFRASHTPN
jgi:hypothetical protein